MTLTPKVIIHAGRRWELLDEADEEIVRSRDDWGFQSLRREFSRCLLRNKPTRVVFRTSIGSRAVRVKALIFDEFRVRLRSLFGRCQGRKEWENHLLAVQCGVPTVRPIALGELRHRLLVHEAVVLTEWCEGSTIEDWRRRNAERDTPTSLAIAAELGRLTALAQRSGLYHNEIRPSNLLVVNGAERAHVLLIDWKHARVKRRTAANDLQNLERTKCLFQKEMVCGPPTAAERRAFMAAYLASARRRGNLPKSAIC